jgi:hypothetical protein
MEGMNNFYSRSMKQTLFVFLFIVCPNLVNAQVKKLREDERGFQLSLFPGISTNGRSRGSFYNKF